MSQRITIVDYGLGNLHSVARAFQHLGFAVELAQDAAGIERADHLVLPGVGAFADGMSGLQSRAQDQAIRRHAASHRPLLGICLGAQLLMDESEEFGRHQGLGLLPGRVVGIPAEFVRVPHVGWSRLQAPPGQSVFRGVLAAVPVGSWAYFLHSFQMLPVDPGHLTAVCSYGPRVISAAVGHGSVHGFQFHPEKSGEFGLEMLRAFASL